MRRTCEDSVRDRLNEIADELAVIAAASESMPSEQAYAEALAAELRRIERVTAGRADQKG
jgi:hypothetical protein